VGAEVFHVDGQTEGQACVMNLNSSFPQFCESVLKGNSNQYLYENQVMRKPLLCGNSLLTEVVIKLLMKVKQQSHYSPRQALRIPEG
jgi:hypothetical protein